MLRPSLLRRAPWPPRRALCTTAAPAPGGAAAAPATPPDGRPWPLRHPKTTLFFAAVGAWAYSLWVGNRTRKLADAVEEEIVASAPANSEEFLELRAFNDFSTRTLQRLFGGGGGGATVARSRPLMQLREAAGKELREHYVLERVLMALPDAGAEPDAEVAAAAGGEVDTWQVGAALSFLPSESVAERMRGLFEFAGGMEAGAVPLARVHALIGALMATGQVPARKQVHSEDVGKNAAGIGRDWYEVAAARRRRPSELHTEYRRAMVAPPPQTWGEWLTTAFGLLAPAPPPPPPPPAALSLDEFTALLVSEAVCVWGECDAIASRWRAQQAREKEECDRASPPWWQFWKSAPPPEQGAPAAAAG